MFVLSYACKLEITHSTKLSGPPLRAKNSRLKPATAAGAAVAATSGAAAAIVAGTAPRAAAGAAAGAPESRNSKPETSYQKLRATAFRVP